MNVIDIIIGIILVFGLVRGLMKGFIVELAGLIAVIAGIYGALHFSYFMIDFLEKNVAWESETINILAFVLTFILIVVLVMIVGKLLTKFANLIALGILNRLLGGIFGLLKMGFLLSVVLLFFEGFNDDDRFVGQKKLDQSVLYQPIRQIAPMVLPSILKEVEKHKTPENSKNSESDFLRL